MVLELLLRDKTYKPTERIIYYTVDKIIGEGRYGICYRVHCQERLFILKQLKRVMLKKAGEKVWYEEEILKSLRHENIPGFIERIELDGFLGYVLEYKEGKTFEDVIYREGHAFAREEIFRVGRRLMDILKYLHTRGIVHRDIRVPNTLYNGQQVNLVDFGLARWIDERKYRADMDFAYLGDFLLHLYYSSFDYKGEKKLPWYRELNLSDSELTFLKRLLGLEGRYRDIEQMEDGFLKAFEDLNQ